jgi:aminopeptidase N
MKNEVQARITLIEALKDKSWYIRNAALSIIEKLNTDEQKSVYQQIRAMALKDDVSRVRASAVTILGKHYSSQDNKDVFARTIKDKSPSVIKATEEIIGK